MNAKFKRRFFLEQGMDYANGKRYTGRGRGDAILPVLFSFLRKKNLKKKRRYNSKVLIFFYHFSCLK